MKTIGDIDNFYREGFIIKSVLLILIYPYLIYGNIVWGNNYKPRLDSLIKIQRK